MRHLSFRPLVFSLIALAAAGALVGCPPGPAAPQITTQPVSVTVNLGGSATLAVAASGDAPLSYQWQKDGVDVAGETAPTLNIASAQQSDAGSYACVVTNSAGSATSNAATVTVNLPSMVVSPRTQVIDADGGSTTFNVENTQAGTTMNWTAAVDAADAWLTVDDPASGTNNGPVTVSAGPNPTTSDRVGHLIVSAPATAGSPFSVMVTQFAGAAPAITTQPASQTAKGGDAVTFAVTATGTPTLSYQWKKGTANISGATAASYTIAAVQNTDEGSFSCVVTNAVGSATSDAATLTVLAKPVASINVKGLNADDIAAAGLETEPSSGLSNVGAGTYVYLEAEASDPDGDDVTYAWSLISKPAGSEAAFLDPNPEFDPEAVSTVAFKTDLVGAYVVQLSVDDGTASKGITTITKSINAGEWVGAGIVKKDGSGITGSTCTGCHNPTNVPAPDKFTPWRETGHATFAAKGVDGEVSSHYGPSCLACHTVGYDTATDNGGFDDVMTALEWTFPSPMQAGNWDSMAANYPDLAKLANIQCENCHGPASEHPDAAFLADKKMDVSMNAEVCGLCHYGTHPQLDEWKLSGHSDSASMAFTYPIGASRAACVKCHSGLGYIDNAEGVPQASQRTSKQIISCAVCHDPHDSTNPEQLRVYDAVTLPGDAAPRTGFGASATCMSCHNGRVTPASATAASPGFTHYSTASEALLGLNAIKFGVDTDLESAHMTINVTCTECHMAATPGNLRDGVHTPGEKEIGGHTFHITFEKEGDPDDGVQNVANACGECHEGLTDINRQARGDYDGNGTVEGVQDEVKGLLNLVLEQILAGGVTQLPSHPYWAWGSVPAEKLTLLEQAVWNYAMVQHEGSYGIHNTAYSVGLLQLTYKQLTGNDIPGAYLRY